MAILVTPLATIEILADPTTRSTTYVELDGKVYRTYVQTIMNMTQQQIQDPSKSELATNVNALMQQVETNTNDISILKNRADTVETNISNINQSINEIIGESGESGTSLAGLDAAIKELQQQIQDIVGGSSGTSLSSLKSSVDSLNSTVSSLSSRISTLENYRPLLQKLAGET